jgi:hypothetical protein
VQVVGGSNPLAPTNKAARDSSFPSRDPIMPISEYHIPPIS